MFDSQSQDAARRPFRVASVGHLAREGCWSLDTPRSYLVPVLFWFTAGQGRLSLDGLVRGFTSHNAIFLPANTSHSCEIGARGQGLVVFFGGRTDLPLPGGLIHLRLQDLQRQTELNQLVDALHRELLAASPFRDEMLYHRSALTLHWLARAEAERAGRPALPTLLRGAEGMHGADFPGPVEGPALPGPAAAPAPGRTGPRTAAPGHSAPRPSLFGRGR